MKKLSSPPAMYVLIGMLGVAIYCGGVHCSDVQAAAHDSAVVAHLDGAHRSPAPPPPHARDPTRPEPKPKCPNCSRRHRAPPPGLRHLLHCTARSATEA